MDNLSALLTQKLNALQEVDVDALINTFGAKRPWKAIRRDRPGDKINDFVQWAQQEGVLDEALRRIGELEERLHNPTRAERHPIRTYLEETLTAHLEEMSSVGNIRRLDKWFVAPSGVAEQQTGIRRGLLDPDLPFAVAAEISFGGEGVRGTSTSVPDARLGLRDLPQVALLGEPGSGKTFLLARVARDFEAAYESTSLLPLYVPLSKYDTEDSFETFCAQRIGPIADLLPELKVVWLLDSLNEMPRGRGQWEHLKSFLNTLVQAGTRFVVTCRVKDYTTELAHVPGLYRVELQDLNPQQIHSLLTGYLGVDDTRRAVNSGLDAADRIWNDVLRGDGMQEAWDAWQAEGGSVRAFWERPTGAEWNWNSHQRARNAAHADPRKLLLLCRNPFALVHLLMPQFCKVVAACDLGHSWQTALNTHLSNNRAALFGKVIDGLLTREAGEQHWMPDHIEGVGKALRIVAAAIQETEQRTEMHLKDLRRLAVWPQVGEDYLRKGQAAGLVTLNDDDTTVRFRHQLFQEYFATSRLRALFDDYDRRHPGWEAGLALPPRDDRLVELFPQWWEVGGWRITAALLGELMDRPGIGRVVRWLAGYAPEIALRCVLDNNDGMRVQDLEPKAQEALVQGALLRTVETDPVGRAAAYRVLGHPDIHADHRQGIGIGPDGLPDFVWGEKISSGTYRIGGDADAFQSLPATIVPLAYSYRLSKYPITNTQFQCFLSDPEGYGNASRWFEGLATDASEREIAISDWSHLNQPRVDVNWYQAMAFCRWLSWRLGGIYSLKRVMDWPVRLPTDVEWEIGCRGSEGLLYAYGNTYDPNKGQHLGDRHPATERSRYIP